MKIIITHPWKISIEKAKKIQNALSKKVVTTSKLSLQEIKTIAACDVSFKQNQVSAAIVIMSFPELKLIEKFKKTLSIKGLFPYIPGYLSFREGPPLISLLKKIKKNVDVILFDGQGISHPRKIGIASHIGVLFDKPAVGCAKNLLCGIYAEPKPQKGSVSFIKDEKKSTIGAALRTRSFVKPVFVSPGHKISLKIAIDLIIKCSPKYRIPEPLREAHALSFQEYRSILPQKHRQCFFRLQVSPSQKLFFRRDATPCPTL